MASRLKAAQVRKWRLRGLVVLSAYAAGTDSRWSTTLKRARIESSWFIKEQETEPRPGAVVRHGAHGAQRQVRHRLNPAAPCLGKPRRILLR